MDIAKIRKKAQEKAGRKEEPQPGAEQASPEELPGSAPAQSGEGQPADEGEPELETGHGQEDAVSEPAGAGEAVEDPHEDAASEEKTELLTFNISGREFAFRLDVVEEIIRYQRVTRVPVLPSYVRGITSLRGKIIPVIEAGIRLAIRENVVKSESAEGSPAKPGNEKIIILSGPKGFIGALVDNVLGVVRFPEKGLLDPPGHLSEEERKFVEAVVIMDGRFISVVRSEEAMSVDVQ
jgi:purine-binding chemotaxis protein CheW